jgi:hypothetical protein
MHARTVSTHRPSEPGLDGDALFTADEVIVRDHAVVEVELATGLQPD